MFLGFFFNDTATTEIYTYGHTLSLHDALPILQLGVRSRRRWLKAGPGEREEAECQKKKPHGSVRRRAATETARLPNSFSGPTSPAGSSTPAPVLPGHPGSAPRLGSRSSARSRSRQIGRASGWEGGGSDG